MPINAAVANLSIARRIRARRLALGLNVVEAARRCGVSWQMMNNLENGWRILAMYAPGLADGLGLSLDELLRDQPPSGDTNGSIFNVLEKALEAPEKPAFADAPDLRDEFAKAALIGAMSACWCEGWSPQRIALTAYGIADAMLAERVRAK